MKKIKGLLEGILDKEILDIGKTPFKIEHIFIILLIYFITKVVLKFIRKGFSIAGRKKKIPRSEWLAYYTFVKYFVWVISATIMLKFVGVDVTVLIAGSSALLVAFALGIQKVFLDFFSGLILLFEKKIKITDILELENGKIVKITNIGMRYSQGTDRDDVTVLIPNSLLINNQVNYWSHNQKSSRFKINVGVAYGTDIKLVNKVLEESMLEHSLVCTNPKPLVRLVGFGDSSLNFELYFWSQEIFRIEQVISDINNIIVGKFSKNNIRIPFPQRDIHIIPQTTTAPIINEKTNPDITAG